MCATSRAPYCVPGYFRSRRRPTFSCIRERLSSPSRGTSALIAPQSKPVATRETRNYGSKSQLRQKSYLNGYRSRSRSSCAQTWKQTQIRLWAPRSPACLPKCFPWTRDLGTSLVSDGPEAYLTDGESSFSAACFFREEELHAFLYRPMACRSFTTSECCRDTV